MRESTFTNAICKAESKQISKDFAYCEDALGRAENAIGNLPSVQPEKRTEERAETHACDLISRIAVYDRVDRIVNVNHLDPELVWFTPIGVKELIAELPSAQPENQVHLCDSCRHVFPECPSEEDDVIYGNGKGNDNICACNKYEPSAQPEIIRCKDCNHHSGSYCHYKYSYGAYVRDDHYCGWAERRKK